MAQPMQSIHVQHVREDVMATVEWSELLRWVPCAPQGDSDPNGQTTDRQDVAVATADEGRRAVAASRG